MNNIAMTSSRTGRVACRRAAVFTQKDVSLLSAELEFMLDEDTYLKKVAGAAAVLVARLDRRALSGKTAMAAFTLAGLIDGMSDEMVSEAVSLLKSS